MKNGIDHLKLIRSKHLNIFHNKGIAIISHNYYGNSIYAERNIVELIDKFYKPLSPHIFRNEYRDEDYRECIHSLMARKFLVRKDEEDGPIFEDWYSNSDKNEKESQQTLRIDRLEISCPLDNLVGSLMLCEKLLPLLEKLEKRSSLNLKKIFVCIPNDEVWRRRQKQYDFPDWVGTFLESRVFLMYHLKKKSQKTITSYGKNTGDMLRHEIAHILLGNRHCYLPVWLEEGICESFIENGTKCIDEGRYKNKKYSYKDIEKDKRQTLMSFDNALTTNNFYYQRSASFVRYIETYLGKEKFWECVKKTGIEKKFSASVKKYANVSLGRIERDWKKEEKYK